MEEKTEQQQESDLKNENSEPTQTEPLTQPGPAGTADDNKDIPSNTQETGNGSHQFRTKQKTHHEASSMVDRLVRYESLDNKAVDRMAKILTEHLKTPLKKELKDINELKQKQEKMIEEFETRALWLEESALRRIQLMQQTVIKFFSQLLIFSSFDFNISVFSNNGTGKKYRLTKYPLIKPKSASYIKG
ncbi:hypothetical protein RFI_17583 [Reticulomyxa filosa]|uniref:Uncharacterized protein n=1 Tax=Reticulomyxa filosa TaxID=46433 RepID=X6N2V0_RETFI|nr:hypothetical protein RFI_17583 [Reticulomyxa filosa]|eukprot:ETO19647.1 hypothetical protein RFI_17583 [Reticulomyxa filosa]